MSRCICLMYLKDLEELGVPDKLKVLGELDVLQIVEVLKVA